MFPTIGHLISGLTGYTIHLPMPTFGFFMTLSFAAAFWVFRAEYKRKEKDGQIHPFIEPYTKLSDQKGGRQLMMTVHPYELMDRLLLYCGIFGFAGAILSARLEGQVGLNYYGALIAGALTYLYINRKQGIPLAIAADIGSPGMMLAYGMGRIGCHLAGDGDWGIVNTSPQPSWLHWTPAWTWAFRFPHNAIHQGSYIPGCTDSYCNILPNPVYPTSFYESLICLLLFAILWTLRTRIRRTGLLFAIFALLNGAERFTIEYIRITPRYTIGSWNLSQAQILALGWIITGLIALTLSLKKRPA